MPPKGHSYIEGDEDKEHTMPIVINTIIEEKNISPRISPNSKKEITSNEF